MKKTVVYIHGKGGSASEAENYKPLFKDYDVIGFDYKSETPLEAKAEFTEFMEKLNKKTGAVTLVANSIGAYFSLISFDESQVEKAYLISPVVDMEELILSMMSASGVTEEELKQRGKIILDFGQTLSWDYLKYARENKPCWNIETFIIYGEKDALVSYKSVLDFSKRIGAELTVMEDGEHWFHTKEQMRFLDLWIEKSF